MPASLAECLSLPRHQLPTLLECLRRTLPSYESRAVSADRRFTYNSAVTQIIQQFGLAAPSPLSSWDHLVVQDNSLRPSNSGLHHSSMIESQLSRRETKLVHGLQGSSMFIKPLELSRLQLAQVSFYIAYARHDEPGLHHPQYLLLIERCARHLRCPPRLLHILVEKLEVQLLGCEGNLNRTKSDICRALKVPYVVAAPVPTNKTARMYYYYKIFCDENLPKLRSLGLQGCVASDEQLRTINLKSKPVVVMTRRRTPQTPTIVASDQNQDDEAEAAIVNSGDEQVAL